GPWRASRRRAQGASSGANAPDACSPPFSCGGLLGRRLLELRGLAWRGPGHLRPAGRVRRPWRAHGLLAAQLRRDEPSHALEEFLAARHIRELHDEVEEGRGDL